MMPFGRRNPGPMLGASKGPDRGGQQYQQQQQQQSASGSGQALSNASGIGRPAAPQLSDEVLVPLVQDLQDVDKRESAMATLRCVVGKSNFESRKRERERRGKKGKEGEKEKERECVC